MRSSIILCSALYLLVAVAVLQVVAAEHRERGSRGGSGGAAPGSIRVKHRLDPPGKSTLYDMFGLSVAEKELVGDEFKSALLRAFRTVMHDAQLEAATPTTNGHSTVGGSGSGPPSKKSVNDQAQAMAQIQQAYVVLSHHESRRIYDEGGLEALYEREMWHLEEELKADL